MARLGRSIRRGNEPDFPIDVEPDEPEGRVWRNFDGSIIILPPIPMSVRDLPPGTRIEVTNRYRGIYVGGGIMIADARRIASYDPNHLFEKVWVPCNPHRVAIKPEWIVWRIE